MPTSGRHHWYPRGLIRHPSPTLGTCLIKTIMLPFSHWDIVHSLQVTGILENRNHLQIKCCGLIWHPMQSRWFCLKWDVQCDHSGTVLFLVSQDRYLCGRKHLGQKINLAVPQRVNAQYMKKILIEKWMSENISIQMQNLMIKVSKSKTELSWKKVKETKENSLLSSFFFLVSLFFLVLLSQQRRLSWIFDWGSYPFLPANRIN